MSQSGGNIQGASDSQFNVSTGPDRQFRIKGNVSKGEGNYIVNTHKRKNREKYVTTKDREYTKEATITINNINIDMIGATAVIEAVEEICGENSVIAVVPDKESKASYEVTMDRTENAYKLTRGIIIYDDEYACTLIRSDVVMVSFLYIPAYVKDEELLKKLTDKDIQILSPVYRRAYPFTQIADGTRYVKVKFPPGLVSLAWSMGFETSAGKKYFKVVHDHQIKVCSECQSPEHIFRNCPYFLCKGCGEQGHKSRVCPAPKCQRCNKLPKFCRCKPDEQLIDSDNEDEMVAEESEKHYTSSEENKSQDQSTTAIADPEEKKNEVSNNNHIDENLNRIDAVDFNDSPDYSEYSECLYCEKSECVCICMNCKEWYSECKCPEYEVVFKKSKKETTEDWDTVSDQNEPKDNVDTIEKVYKHTVEVEIHEENSIDDNSKVTDIDGEKMTKTEEIVNYDGVGIDSFESHQIKKNNISSGDHDEIVVIEEGEYNHENDRAVDHQDVEKEIMEYENTVDHVKKDISGGESSTTLVSVNNTKKDGNGKDKRSLKHGRDVSPKCSRWPNVNFKTPKGKRKKVKSRSRSPHKKD